MDPHAPTPIHVDYEVNQHDLFRLSLSLEKWRIVIGFFVAAIPAIGLTYVFILIDEKEFFLQVSPLFVGMPLIAAGGQILRLHAACRKYVKALPASQRHVQYLFQQETDGYDRTSGESFSHVSWKDVAKAVEKPTCFILYQNRYEGRLVPKQGFHLPAEISVFRSILSAKLGPRAKLFQPAA